MAERDYSGSAAAVSSMSHLFLAQRFANHSNVPPEGLHGQQLPSG